MNFLESTMLASDDAGQSVSGRSGLDVAVAPTVFRQPDYAARLGTAKHIFLVILDGLGYNYLIEQPDSFLCQTLRGRMGSVFPSSTAPGIGAYLSGLSPATHGIFGWFQWMGAVGQVCASLPFASRATGLPLADFGVKVSDCVPFSSFFERLSRPSWAYSPEAIAYSPFNTYATRGATRQSYKNWAELVSKVQETTRGISSNSYQYIYWPDFDSSCHQNGLYSEATLAQFRIADQGVSALVKALASEDVAIIITADHGMIDTTAEERLSLEDFPEVAKCLTMPLCGEPRVVYCHVRASVRDAFPDIVVEHLGKYCDCYDAQTLVAEGWFGSVSNQVPAHRFDALGDYVLIMKDHYTLEDVLPGEKGKNFIGMHGGITNAEMEVPLCWVGDVSE